MREKSQLSIDSASQEILNNIPEVETIWQRYEKMLPQCGFGLNGLCCRNCVMGPCRIDPFGEGPDKGICGATAGIISMRNLMRMVAAGSAAHSDHGRHIAHTLLMTGEEKAGDYQIKGKEKLHALAKEYGIDTENTSDNQLAIEVAKAAYSDFSRQEGEMSFIKRAPEKRQELWRKLGIVPRGIDREIVELMNRTLMGVDNDELSLVKQGFRTALSNGWGGSMIATELSDVLFDAPKPVRAKVNLGVLRQENVNIVVHGHEPTLSDIMVVAASDPELIKYAKSKGADGICLGGICCTANEILMRHGVPIVGNFMQQELAITTGIVDVMLVDVQCVIPALGSLCKCYHTKMISTSPIAKFPYAEHMEFDEKNALDIARKIVRTAIDNYSNRIKEKYNTSSETMDCVAGFTAENIFTILGGKYRASYRPLNDAIISGRLRGAVGIVGCNNPKQMHDYGHITLAKELIKNNVLVVSTGCSAIASAKAGLLKPEAVELCGKGLREVCEAVGIPPVLHSGACVDISRILITLCNSLLEGGLGNDFSDLPVAGAAPEWMSEKAV
ncbi:MAG: anaerobic carbon-monoxide dehydrogenase catalytic subunit, partial [Ruminiclostridium sp.]|nr:anaerobic carbon-monoxide dehydrogenase catalytic subunit [Ruminiclostridium sp.]